MSDATTRKNPFEELFEEPLVLPEGEHGVGPTLGMDLDKDEKGREPDPEPRSFAPPDERVLRGARSA